MWLTWVSGTRYHDWSDGAHLRRLLELARGAEVIGPAQWMQAGVRTDRLPVRIEAGRLPAKVQQRIVAGEQHLALGGSEPHPWELFLLVLPWSREQGHVDGASFATFRFAGEAFATPAGSERLVDAMLAAHTPETTEFALVHPYERSVDLAVDVYKPPLVNSQMIAGAYWACFLGPGHIDEFDRGRLRQVGAYRVEWRGEDGVLFVAFPVVTDAATSEGERELVRLTDELRRALRAET